MPKGSCAKVGLRGRTSQKHHSLVSRRNDASAEMQEKGEFKPFAV